MATHTTAHRAALTTEAAPTRLLAMFAVILFGLAASAYLAFSYLGVTPLSCTDTGCDFIRSWHDARFPKGLLPLGGVSFFLVGAALTARLGTASGDTGRAQSRLNMGWSVIGALVMLTLVAVEVNIHTFCFWCTLVAGSAFLYCALAAWEAVAWKSSVTGYRLHAESFLKWGWLPLVAVVLMAASLDPHGIDATPPAPQSATPPPSQPPVPANVATPSTPIPPGPATDVPAPEALVRPWAHSKGPANAPVTLVEFADPGCHVCAEQAPIIEAFVARHPKDVRFVFRNFPLRSHPYSRYAASAMESAAAQGDKFFWAMRQTLYSYLNNQTPDDLMRYAQQIGLDMARFRMDFLNNRFMDRVQKDREDGERLKVNETPTMFMNHVVRFSGRTDLEHLEAAYRIALREAKKTPPAKPTLKPTPKPSKPAPKPAKK